MGDEQALITLKRVAAIAHSGGLVGLDQFDALCVIRRLTLRYWDSKQSEDAGQFAVVDALRASDSV